MGNSEVSLRRITEPASGPVPAAVDGLPEPSPTPKPRRRRGARLSLYYVVMGLSGVLGLAKSFAYAKVWEGETLGYYALAMLVASYGELFAHFGLYRGLE